MSPADSLRLRPAAIDSTLGAVDLSFIIVFGTRWHFRDSPGVAELVLNCPLCRRPEPMQRQEAFKAFTLYWWPLFKVRDGGSLLRCTECGERFHLPPELGGAAEEEGSAREAAVAAG